ncbi:MAG: hypothetical protein HDR71_12285 [Lachnospiraceae bacterium]|nr:hypothetical protein [Lachnospiraceae bacterium]
MPTPPKPYKVIQGEKRSHRTKAELNMRKQAEEALSTKAEIKKRKEVRENPVANKEFNRVSKLLDKIDKNDALYEPVINRYCMIQAECKELEDRRDTFNELIQIIKEKISELSKEERQDYIDDLVTISNSLVKLAGQMNACDKLLQQKRKMLFDIEKENIMTIASALRSIPKKEEKKINPLLEALGG